MEIREIKNKEEWEGFCLQCKEKTFLQSWNWGDFNLAMGEKIWRLGVYNNKEQAVINKGQLLIKEQLLGVALVIKTIAKRGTFLFIPHGPIILEELDIKEKKEIFKSFLLCLKNITKKEKASFIRLAPILQNTKDNKTIFSELSFREAPIHASAYEATWKLDITPLEEELFKNMRKTTRYLIKKTSENKDITIEKSIDLKDIETFQKLNKEVSKRQRFVSFSDDFVKNEFKIFSESKEALFLFAKHKGEIAAGALVIFWSNIAFYHQAASLEKFSKISAPYLLQWEAIKEAKKRGCLIYDFWGFTDPERFPKHPWAGPTLFKMGFGGSAKEYVKTQDYIISKKYWINYIIEKARKLKRRL